MDDAYGNALRTVADAYEAEAERWGGKSLSRIANIVASSGAFFIRLREGRSFSVLTLEKFANWFRDPSNWPGPTIPEAAATALSSIGRTPVQENAAPASCVMEAARVRSNDAPVSDRSPRA